MSTPEHQREIAYHEARAEAIKELESLVPEVKLLQDRVLALRFIVRGTSDRLKLPIPEIAQWPMMPSPVRSKK